MNLLKYFRSDDIVEYSYLLGRGVFHVTYRGRCKGEEVVIRKFSYPLESDDLMLQEILEEDKKRIRINSLKSDYIVHHIGTLADWPDFGLVARFYSKGSLYTDLVERRNKVKFTNKQIAKFALDISAGIKAVHDIGLVVKVKSHNRILNLFTFLI